MGSTLIFKKIHEENELTWKDTARVLGYFISEALDMVTLMKKLIYLSAELTKTAKIHQKVTIKVQHHCLLSLQIGSLWN